MKFYMKFFLFTFAFSFSFSVYGMHQQEAPFKLDEKRLEIVIGNKNNLNKTADKFLRMMLWLI